MRELRALAAAGFNRLTFRPTDTRNGARIRDGYNERMSGSDEVNRRSSGLKLTYEGLLQLPDDGRQHELIDGEHLVTPAPVPSHQTILWKLVAAFDRYLEANPIGRAFMAPLDVVLSDVDVVQPDLLYVARARVAGLVTETHVAGAPDLVVEIESPSSRKRDETTKRHLFESYGVTEYWVIDPELQIVKVFRRREHRLSKVEELAAEAGDVLTTPLLPGLESALVGLFTT